MFKRLSQLAFVIFITGMGTAVFADPGSASLSLAQEQFAQGQLKEMAKSLRLALLDAQDGPVQQQAFQLLEQAYERVGSAGIPADVTFPQEITSLRVDFNRIDRGQDIVFRAQVHVGVRRGVKLSKVQLFRSGPRLRLVDNGVPALGTLEHEGNDPTKYTISADLPEGGTYSMPGLYQLRVTPENGQRFITTFITSQNMASASPEFTTPECQIFETQKPTLRFASFESPEHKAFETRSLELIANFHPKPNPPFVNVVTQKLLDPDATQITFGVGELGKTPLVSEGVYRVVIDYLEGRKFGPIVVNRGSQKVSSIRVLLHGQPQECF